LVHVITVTPVLFVIPAVGTVLFSSTVMLDVEVQPFALVTVTVYVPGAVIVASALLPKTPLQEYVPFPEAVTLILGFVHVNVVTPVLFVIIAPGAVISFVIVMLDVDVQPFAPVTVTVYVSGAVIVACAAVPKPPLQEYVPFPEAVTLILGFVHVNVVVPVLFVMLAPGKVISFVIVMLDVEVQPFALDTVTV